MKENGRTVVISAFIRKDGKYLIVYDPKFKFWRVPGGRVEEGEKEEETLKREIFEELDIKIKVEKYLGDGKDNVDIYLGSRKGKRSRKIKYYGCTIDSRTIKIKQKNEASKYRWESLEEIKKIDNLEPAMKDYFSK